MSAGKRGPTFIWHAANRSPDTWRALLAERVPGVDTVEFDVPLRGQDQLFPRDWQGVDGPVAGALARELVEGSLGAGLGACLDIKCPCGHEAEVPRVLSALLDYRSRDLVVISRNHEVARTAARSGFRAGPIVECAIPNFREYCRQLESGVVVASPLSISPPIAQELKNEGIRLLLFPPRTGDRMREALDYNPDSIMLEPQDRHLLDEVHIE